VCTDVHFYIDQVLENHDRLFLTNILGARRSLALRGKVKLQGERLL